VAVAARGLFIGKARIECGGKNQQCRMVVPTAGTDAQILGALQGAFAARAEGVVALFVIETILAAVEDPGAGQQPIDGARAGAQTAEQGHGQGARDPHVATDRTAKLGSTPAPTPFSRSDASW